MPREIDDGDDAVIVRRGLVVEEGDPVASR